MGEPCSAIVGELQRDVEVPALEQCDDSLQVVLLLARDAQLVALDLGLHALELLVPDSLGDLFGLLLADARLATPTTRDQRPVERARIVLR